MEVPRLRVKSELQRPAYTTATRTEDLSCICDLHHSSQQCRIPNPLSEARDGTCILAATSQVCNQPSLNANSCSAFKSLLELIWLLLGFGTLRF